VSINLTHRERLKDAIFKTLFEAHDREFGLDPPLWNVHEDADGFIVTAHQKAYRVPADCEIDQRLAHGIAAALFPEAAARIGAHLAIVEKSYRDADDVDEATLREAARVLSDCNAKLSGRPPWTEIDELRHQTHRLLRQAEYLAATEAAAEQRQWDRALKAYAARVERGEGIPARNHAAEWREKQDREPKAKASYGLDEVLMAGTFAELDELIEWAGSL
jgi:hypothetical protein